MKKYYYAKVCNFCDERYEDILEYDHNYDNTTYLKNIVESYRIVKGFLGFKFFDEYFDKFPIIVEKDKENNIIDMVTGDIYHMLPNEMDYKGDSELTLYLGEEITPVKVANELKRLLPTDIERYKLYIEKLKSIANKISQEDKIHSLEQAKLKQEEETNAQNYIAYFTKVYRNSK